LAPAFASYCSIDCRDGGLVLAEFSMVDCPECEGTGIWRKGAFGNDRECFSCRATGKITPAKRKSLLERADTPRAKRAAKFGP